MQATDLYHPQFIEFLTKWQKVEDVCSGEETVKCRNEIYLPRLHGQSDAEYRSFQARATFFGATKRTREALIGMLLRKPPKITVPKEIETLLGDIDLEGGSAKNWIRAVCAQTVSTGRSATVCDWNEAEKRPYLSFYPAVNVVNWFEERLDGRKELTLLTLKECAEERAGSTVTIKDVYREYSIDKETGNVQIVTKQGGTNGEFIEQPPIFPLRRGLPLKRIPAVVHNASHLGWNVGEVPLLDIADLNIHLYMASADIWNGRHVAGVPTPWATGVDEKTELILGTSKAWVASDEKAKFGWLEFQGQGLQSLKEGIEEIKSEMAILGARLLFDGKSGVEAFDTVKLRAVSETAALSNMSGFLTASLTMAIRWLIWWEGTMVEPTDIDPTMGVIVNDDFVDTPMDSTTLAALVAAFQADAISFSTFYHQLKNGEIYPDDWDMEMEIAAIGQRPAVTIPVAPTEPGSNPKPDPNAN